MTDEKKTPQQPEVSQEAKDYFGSARSEFKKGLDAMFPPEVKEHHKAAQKEVLNGIKSLIDAALEKFDDNDE